jgi:Arc/MetJ family transcription regulator
MMGTPTRRAAVQAAAKEEVGRNVLKSCQAARLSAGEFSSRNDSANTAITAAPMNGF